MLGVISVLLGDGASGALQIWNLGNLAPGVNGVLYVLMRWENGLCDMRGGDNIML